MERAKAFLYDFSPIVERKAECETLVTANINRVCTIRLSSLFPTGVRKQPKETNTYMNITSKWKYALGLVLATVALLSIHTASADDLTNQSRAALQQLVAQNPAAAKANRKALAVLVFPDVIKAGFILGAQGGKGILFVRGRPNGRYRTVALPTGCKWAFKNTATPSS
jgi:hypothetical protein